MPPGKHFGQLLTIGQIIMINRAAMLMMITGQFIASHQMNGDKATTRFEDVKSLVNCFILVGKMSKSGERNDHVENAITEWQATDIRLHDADVVKGEIMVGFVSYSRGKIDTDNKAGFAYPVAENIKKNTGPTAQITDLKSFGDMEIVDNMG